MTDECSIDLTRTPFLREMVGVAEDRTETDPWLPMKEAPLDRFVIYRLADVEAESVGCIDSVTPNRVWIPHVGAYWPPVRFSGWKLLPYKHPRWGE